MAQTDKERIMYQRGTEELKQKSIRAHKLVQEFNRSDVEDFEKKRKPYSRVVRKCR
ncbi:hypothetical protein GCM10020331_095220 [Ectobacillus funiculus]